MSVRYLNPHAEQLHKARTSADFSEFLTVMYSDLADARTRLAALKVSQDRAIFGDGDIAEVLSEIAGCNSLIESLEIVIEGAAKRRDAARETEQIANLEDLAAECQEQEKALSEKWRAAALLIEGARGEIIATERLKDSIIRKNIQFEAAGRNDLVVAVDRVRREAVGKQSPTPEGLPRRVRDRDRILKDIFQKERSSLIGIPGAPVKWAPNSAIRTNA